MTYEKICPKCGATNGMLNKFCTSCGYKLDVPAKNTDDTVAVEPETTPVGNSYTPPPIPASAPAGNTPHISQPVEPQTAPVHKTPVADAAKKAEAHRAFEAKKSEMKTAKPTPENAPRKGSRTGRSIIMILLAVIAFGCGAAAVYLYLDKHNSSYTSSDSDENDKKDDADSTKTDYVAANKEAAPAPAGQDYGAPADMNVQPADEYIDPEVLRYRKNFSSYDLTLCDLHGRVSTAYLFEDGRQKAKYDFLTDGSLTSASTVHSNDNLRRDEKGRATSEYTPQGEIYYEWRNGNVAEVYSSHDGNKRYIYSAKGELQGIETTNDGVSRTERYVDYQYDPYLNWIRRTRISPNGIRYTQTRTINYFNN